MSSLEKLINDAKCGVGINSVCEGVTVDFNVPGIKLATSEIVSILSFGLQVASQGIAGDLTFNQVRAVNSARCALLFSGENIWTFLAGTYYLIKQFASAAEMQQIQGYIDEYYPYVCTCKIESDDLSELFGGNDETAAVMSACSEKAQIDAVANKADTMINLAFNIVFPGGTSGPWSNATVPEKSNVTFSYIQALSILGGAVGGMGWDYQKLNVTQATATYGDFDMADGNMNRTSLRPFINKVFQNQGEAMAPQEI
jgi:formylmethanofuran dehydrogenase subunit D